MSSPIQPSEAPGHVPAAASVTPTRASAAAPASAPSEVEGAAAVSVDTIPSAPPQEVLDQMDRAAGTYAALESQGLSVRYGFDASARRANAELVDREGRVVRTLTPSEAVALSAGEAPADL